MDKFKPSSKRRRPSGVNSRNGRRPGGAQSSLRRRAPGHQKQSSGDRSVVKGQLPTDLVYGINPVSVALDTTHLKVLYFDKGRGGERIQQLHAQAQSEGVEIQPLQRQGWSRILPADIHQGVAGKLHSKPLVFLEEIVGDAGDNSCILVLDQIQDPQNLGAVLRTAAATSVDAVVLPKAGGCSVTPAVHKASAGMSMVVPIVEDENLVRAIEFLKDNDYWVVGCDSGDGEDATVFEFPKKRVIVMGNEAEGMRRLVKESCDYLVKLPMAAGIESLNISVATGVVLYLAQADLARAELEAVAENGEPGLPGETPENDKDSLAK